MSTIPSVKSSSLKCTIGVADDENDPVMPAHYGREHGNPELVYPCVSTILAPHPREVLTLLSLTLNSHETIFQPGAGRSLPWARYG